MATALGHWIAAVVQVLYGTRRLRWTKKKSPTPEEVRLACQVAIKGRNYVVALRYRKKRLLTTQSGHTVEVINFHQRATGSIPVRPTN